MEDPPPPPSRRRAAKSAAKHEISDTVGHSNDHSGSNLNSFTTKDHLGLKSGDGALDGVSTIVGEVDGLEAEDIGIEQTTPYHKRPFLEFIKTIARIFYDEYCLVLLEILGESEKAFTESDLRETLGWRDNLLHSKLLLLEQQLILQKYQNSSKGTRSPIYWRISPYVVITMKFHCDKFIASLQKDVNATEHMAEFSCPACNKLVNALDILTGPRRLTDEHPLCPNCPDEIPLTPSNFDQARTQARQRLHRGENQLRIMYDLFRKLISMKIPQFPPWTRADKNDVDRSLKIMNDQQEAVKAQKVADAEAKQREIQMQQAAQLAGLSSHKSPVDSGPKKLISAAKEKGASIPWFQQQGVSGSQVGGSQVKGRNTSGSDIDSTSSVAQKKRAAVSFSFGKSQPKKKQIPSSGLAQVTTVFKDSQQDDTTQTKSNNHNSNAETSVTAATQQNSGSGGISALSFDDLLKSSLKDASHDDIKTDITPDQGGGGGGAVKVGGTDEENKLPSNKDELSLYITSLDKMVTVQEVMSDPELESKMTDEEYEKFASLQEIYEEHHMK